MQKLMVTINSCEKLHRCCITELTNKYVLARVGMLNSMAVTITESHKIIAPYSTSTQMLVFAVLEATTKCGPKIQRSIVHPSRRGLAV